MADDPIQTFIDEVVVWRDRLRDDPESGHTSEFLEFSKA